MFIIGVLILSNSVLMIEGGEINYQMTSKEALSTSKPCAIIDLCEVANKVPQNKNSQKMNGKIGETNLHWMDIETSLHQCLESIAFSMAKLVFRRRNSNKISLCTMENLDVTLPPHIFFFFFFFFFSFYLHTAINRHFFKTPAR